MKELSALDVRYLVQEFTKLVDGKVDHIYMPNRETILFQFHKTGVGKKIMRIAFPHFVYLSDHKGQMPEKPPGLCMFLRKHLRNARLRSVKQLDFERIIELVIATKDSEYQVYIELIHPGNFVVVKDNKIMVALVQKKWKDRVVRPGVPYEHPQKEHNPLEINELMLRELFAHDDREVVRVLATGLSLGGKYAEELCARAQVNKDAQSLNVEESKRVIDAFKEMLNHKPEAFVVKEGEKVIDIVPFPLQKYLNSTLEQHESFSEALDNILTTETVEKIEQEITTTHNKALGKSERILDQQRRMLVSVEEGQAENQKCGEAIYENYQVVQDILEQLKTARETMSWKEIKEKLKGHAIIKSINEKEGTVTIEL